MRAESYGFVDRARYKDKRARIAMMAKYADGVREADQALGRLLDGLGERERRPLLLVAADHGEFMAEPLDRLGFAYGHGLLLGPEVAWVPLVATGPGIDPGRIAGAVSLADLYTTILEAAGVGDALAEAEQRVDLRDDLPAGRVAYTARRAVRAAQLAKRGANPAAIRAIGARALAATDGASLVMVGDDGRPAERTGAPPELVAAAQSALAAQRPAQAAARPRQPRARRAASGSRRSATSEAAAAAPARGCRARRRLSSAALRRRGTCRAISPPICAPDREHHPLPRGRRRREGRDCGPSRRADGARARRRSSSGTATCASIPRDPAWPLRDRFVLSAGHASMLLYSLLHLFGFDLPLRRARCASASSTRRRPGIPSTATRRASR